MPIFRRAAAYFRLLPPLRFCFFDIATRAHFRHAAAAHAADAAIALIAATAARCC